MVNLNTIKSWFKSGLKPTQTQFWETWDSFWHKEDRIPVSQIDGVDDLLNQKANGAVLNDHLNSTSAHTERFSAIIDLIENKADTSSLNDHFSDQQAHASLFSLKEDKLNKGEKNGYAPLNNDGKIPSQFIEKIDLDGYKVEGSQYTLVLGNSSPTINAEELQSAYDLAKLKPGLSDSNRFKILIGPGVYSFDAAFEINANYVDLVSLSGETDVNLPSGIYVSANDVYLKGLKTNQSFSIATNLSGLFCVKCKGGNGSFGLNVIVSGTFINCIAGLDSFGSSSMGEAAGTFIDCLAKSFSFGFANASGRFINCSAGSNSFGGTGVSSGYFYNCYATNNSFGKLGGITGHLFLCRLFFDGLVQDSNQGTFNSASGQGRLYFCVDGFGNIINQ